MIVLVLENDTDIYHHQFYETDDLEVYLKKINQEDYMRTNIIVNIDGELNFVLSKLFKKRYLASKKKSVCME
jgi:hypothetical protein